MLSCCPFSSFYSWKHVHRWRYSQYQCDVSFKCESQLEKAARWLCRLGWYNNRCRIITTGGVSTSKTSKHWSQNIRFVSPNIALYREHFWNWWWKHFPNRKDFLFTKYLFFSNSKNCQNSVRLHHKNRQESFTKNHYKKFFFWVLCKGKYNY